MTAFTLPPDDGEPLEIIDYKIDLLSSPPEIQEEIIERIENYVSAQTDCIKIDYKNAITDEGKLNIYLCRCRTGKYYLHIFGKIKGQEFRTEKVLTENQQVQLHDHIKSVLISSRNILKRYYLHANLKSMENHLVAFIVP